MEKQIFFFDIDGTLVDSTTHIVPESTKLALKALKQQGHIICISTGRSLQSVCDSKFDQLADWDIFLCNNGQAYIMQKKSFSFLNQLHNRVLMPVLMSPTNKMYHFS